MKFAVALHRGWLLTVPLALSVIASGCATSGYYLQSVQGHLDLMSRRVAIDELLQDGATPAPLRRQLQEVLAIRAFALSTLALPEGGSYESYADLDRPYVVWTVAATPEFSLDPVTWCFPVAGCVSYRGYFTESGAKHFAEQLRADGMDVYVGGVRAYSTLGWFDDPVLSSMLGHHRFYLAGVIFHELAHQRVYLAGDSAFNEAYATVVEREGVRRWLDARGAPGERGAYLRVLERREEFLALVGETRRELAALYADTSDDEFKRARKARALAQLRERHAGLERDRGEDSPYGQWFEGEINNAKLAMIATYNELVPAFAALLREQGGDFAAFHEACAALAVLPEKERQRRLQTLAEGVRAPTARAVAGQTTRVTSRRQTPGMS